MGWLSWLPGIFKGGKDIAEVFKPNAEKKSVRDHQERMADMGLDSSVLQQFAAEFHERKNRTWWDSVVDGLNRLPRPLLTFAVLSFFVIAPFWPERFAEISQAYANMPPGYWGLLSVIVGFYFGGRMQLKGHDMAMKGAAVQAAKELVSKRKEFRELVDDDDSTEDKQYRAAVSDGHKPIENEVVTKWKKSRGHHPRRR